MPLAGAAFLPALAAPNVRLFFLVNVLTVVAVTVFATVLVTLLLRRRYQRGLEEQKMAVIGTTTARILHQIKNPVQSLLLQAELLEEFEREGADEQRREAGRAIVGEAMRLATMLSELSAWTSGGRRPLQPVPTSLRDLLGQMARQEAREAERRGVRLETSLPVEAVAPVDAYYLRQALENLVRNAQEAMQGQPDARLRLELEHAGARARIRVIDNGPGIPADRRGEIFEPFVSTKGSGMGLGLAICREIIERHGGGIDVASTPGAGTTFTVTLPLHAGGGAPATPRPDDHHAYTGDGP